jgi:hypothetical protein
MFEHVSQIISLEIIVRSQNLIQEEIKGRLNSDNACYHSVQNLLSSHLLSKYVKLKIYKTMIFPVVLYGSETWSLTLRKEHTLRVFENRVLRIIGLKKDDVMGRWRNLHKEELHDLYSLPSISRSIRSMGIRCTGHVARMWEKRNMYRLLVGKPEGKKH